MKMNLYGLTLELQREKKKGGKRHQYTRISKARKTLARLNKIWGSRQYSRQIKIKLYKSIVRPLLLYGSETWKMTKQDEQKSGLIPIPMPEKKYTRFCPNIISMEKFGIFTQTQGISEENSGLIIA